MVFNVKNTHLYTNYISNRSVYCWVPAGSLESGDYLLGSTAVVASGDTWLDRYLLFLILMLCASARVTGWIGWLFTWSRRVLEWVSALLIISFFIDINSILLLGLPSDNVQHEPPRWSIETFLKEEISVYLVQRKPIHQVYLHLLLAVCLLYFLFYC